MIYVIVHSASGDSFRSYDGQRLEKIQELVQSEGKTFEVITQKQYEDFIEATRVPVAKDTDLERSISDAKNTQKTDTERINALIEVLGL